MILGGKGGEKKRLTGGSSRERRVCKRVSGGSAEDSAEGSPPVSGLVAAELATAFGGP